MGRMEEYQDRLGDACSTVGHQTPVWLETAGPPLGLFRLRNCLSKFSSTDICMGSVRRTVTSWPSTSCLCHQELFLYIILDQCRGQQWYLVESQRVNARTDSRGKTACIYYTWKKPNCSLLQDTNCSLSFAFYILTQINQVLEKVLELSFRIRSKPK